MKLQVSRVAKFALVAALSLSAINMVGAQSTEPTPVIIISEFENRVALVARFLLG
jgi:hypothetical protein